jgi:adenylylsulfate kinase-like enzyme
MEVYVDCPLEECVRRDPKGIYRDGLRANSDNIPGLQSEYENPLDPEVVVSGREDSVDDAVDPVISALTDRGFIGAVDSQ